MPKVGDTRDGREMASEARLRGSVYGLLARIYRKEPDIGLVRDLRRPEVFDGLVDAGLRLAATELLAPPCNEVVDALVDDYTALFVSPGTRTPPYESVHRSPDGSLMGETTVQVRELIDSLGLTIDNHWTEFPDHLAIELEILQKLADAEAAGLERGDDETALRYRVRRQTFLENHVAEWVPQFCDAIESRATTAFFRELARLTRVLVCAGRDRSLREPK